MLRLFSFTMQVFVLIKFVACLRNKCFANQVYSMDGAHDTYKKVKKRLVAMDVTME